jgi:predicted metal-dependent hydrolase
MYGMKNPYMAEGGQPQINKEQAMVQQLIQAFAQLSPQGQQMFIQGVQQMMEQSQGQEQNPQQEMSQQDQMQ